MKTYVDFYGDVQCFHAKYAIQPHMLKPTSLNDLPQDAGKARVAHLKEELTELESASTVAEQLDALVDLVYVAMGTACMMGLPFEAAWKEVHDANMRKIKQGYSNKQGIVKPPDWVAPNIEKVLTEA